MLCYRSTSGKSPVVDFLEDGVYELRARRGRVNYRLLDLFHGQNVAVLAHALSKRAVIPAADMRRAPRRKLVLEASPAVHTYEHSVD